MSNKSELFIEQYFNDPDRRILLSFIGGEGYEDRTFSGVIEDGFGFSQSATFNSNDLSPASNAIDTLANTVGAWTGASSKIMNTLVSTVSDWGGNSKPTFTVKLSFPKYSSNAPGLDKVKELLSLAAPNFKSGIVEAPGGFTRGMKASTALGNIADTIINQSGNAVEAGKDAFQQSNGALSGAWNAASTAGQYLWAQGTENLSYDSLVSEMRGIWSIKVGKWLFIKHLALTNVDFSSSVELVKGGVPLICSVTLSFIPVVQPDAATIKSWFIDQANVSTTSKTNEDNGAVKNVKGQTGSVTGKSTPVQDEQQLRKEKSALATYVPKGDIMDKVFGRV